MPCAPPGRGRTAARGALPFGVDAVVVVVVVVVVAVVFVSVIVKT